LDEKKDFLSLNLIKEVPITVNFVGFGYLPIMTEAGEISCANQTKPRK